MISLNGKSRFGQSQFMQMIQRETQIDPWVAECGREQVVVLFLADVPRGTFSTDQLVLFKYAKELGNRMSRKLKFTGESSRLGCSTWNTVEIDRNPQPEPCST